MFGKQRRYPPPKGTWTIHRRGYNNIHDTITWGSHSPCTEKKRCFFCSVFPFEYMLQLHWNLHLPQSNFIIIILYVLIFRGLYWPLHVCLNPLEAHNSFKGIAFTLHPCRNRVYIKSLKRTAELCASMLLNRSSPSRFHRIGNSPLDPPFPLRSSPHSSPGVSLGNSLAHLVYAIFLPFSI